MQLRREKKRENRSQSHNLTLMGEEKKKHISKSNCLHRANMYIQQTESKIVIWILHSTASATPSGQFTWSHMQFPKENICMLRLPLRTLVKQIFRGYANLKLFHNSTYPY